MAADVTRLTTRIASRRPAPGWLRTLRHDWFIFLAMSAGLVVALLPIIFMLNISVKTPGQFLTKPLELTAPFAWDNYVIALNVLKRSILNTFGMTVVVVTLSLAVSAMAGRVSTV